HKRRISSKQHPGIGRGWPRNSRKVLVAQSGLSSISKVGRNISRNELLADRSRLASQPCTVSMIRVPWGRIRRPRHVHPVGPGKGPEVIVEGMIFLENDHNVINFARSTTACLLLPRRHVKH